MVIVADIQFSLNVDPNQSNYDVRVVLTSLGDPLGSVAHAEGLSPQQVESLNSLIELLEISGKADETVLSPAPDGLGAKAVLFSGLGASVSDWNESEQIRRAVGAALRRIGGKKSVVVPVSPKHVGAAAEGAGLGDYLPRVSARAETPGAKVTIAATGLDELGAHRAVERAGLVAEAVNATRDLINESPLHLYPATFADRVVELTKGRNLTVKVWDENELTAEGFGGISAVGQGSSRPPRLVKIEYKPTGATKHVALVGKGITFDSGGLSLKPAGSMVTMKCDMAGGAAVLHAILVAHDMHEPVAVTAWIALAENLPSATAQRPSDVITMYGGKTVEVLNTDAEGRLVLADILVAAAEEKPDIMVDIATLTGAQMVALGNQVSAVMGSDDATEALLSASREAGEQFWPMPLPEELKDSLKSPQADLANIGDRFGGMLTAGLFLQEFVGETSWAHLDIAGPAFNEGAARHYTPKGGTGVGVRTLIELITQAGKN